MYQFLNIVILSLIFQSELFILEQPKFLKILTKQNKRGSNYGNIQIRKHNYFYTANTALGYTSKYEFGRREYIMPRKAE